MKFYNKENGVSKEINELFCYLSNDDELVSELLKTNYKYDEPSWYYNDDSSLKDAIKIKVNIKDVGFVIVYFDKDFDKEARKELISNILELKKINVNDSYEKLKKKLVEIFTFFNDNNPLFGIFMINNYHEEIDRILIEIEGMNYPLYCVKGESITPEVIEEHVEPKADDNQNLGQKFKDSLKNIIKYKIEHLFNALYSMLIAVCALLSSIYIDNNNNGVGILFICFMILFVFLIAYNLHLYSVDNKGIKLFDYIFFVTFSLIGIVLGMVLGYFLAKGLVKFGDTPINYSKNIKIAIAISIPALIVAHGVRFLISFLYKKIKSAK